ncbi:MAG: phosphate-starvation-inducible PsiE family protein [Sulfuriferula sp.]|nr:phosphate-starvation-inducible PsiE family protein [Sulfuriferula sp.]
MFENRLILLLSHFNKLLHIALAIALVIASLMVIWQFSVEVINAVVSGHLVRGFLQSLGTLFLVWTLSSLISAETSYLQNGIFQVRVFIEVVIITLLRQIIVDLSRSPADNKI